MQDTCDILNILKTVEFDVERQLLVTIDIESLYTSIPQGATLVAAARALESLEWFYDTPVFCLAV